MGRRSFGLEVVGAIAAGACGAVMLFAACSNKTDSTPATVACTPSKTLEIHFAPMYSAFVTDNTSHTFQIPAIVTGGSGTVTWTASPSAAVTFAPDPATGGTMMTVKAATPTVTITAQVGSLCTTSELHVTSALEADWKAGNARYNNGVPVYPGCVGAKLAPALAEAGIDLPPPPDGGCPEAGPACTGCHGSTPTAGFFAGVQHTPEQTGGFSDQALVDIFVRGTDPTFDTSYLPYEYWHVFHTWTDIATPEQQKAMIVYLRSLAPAPEDGGINFGVLKDAGILD
jgi:hypothetical protein